MAEITLAELFPGATQDLTTVTIPKSALTGLTAIAANRADQIVAAVVHRLTIVYPTTKRNGNDTANPVVPPDLDVSCIAEFGSRSISTDFETGTEYQQQTFNINFFKPLPTSTFDSDDY